MTPVPTISDHNMIEFETNLKKLDNVSDVEDDDVIDYEGLKTLDFDCQDKIVWSRVMEDIGSVDWEK